MKNYLMIGLTLLTFIACTPQTRKTEGSLANTKWTLVSFGKPGAETPVVEGSAITLEFDGEKQVSGSGGCNSYGAQYAVQGDVLSISQLISTLMACEQEGIGQQEQIYFQALKSASKYELDGNHLTIWYSDGKAVLNFIKM